MLVKSIKKCFTSCSGVHSSNVAWKHAQLSLSRGGRCLRSLSHHAPAALIASICLSDRGSNSNAHLFQAIEMFNSSVHPSEIIHYLKSSIRRRLFPWIIIYSMFSRVLCLLPTEPVSYQHPPHMLHHAWLTVIPSEGQGLHLDPPVFQAALKWWLGLDTAEGSPCALCPDKMLDPLGHHATTCKRGGDAVFRHNKLRDILAEININCNTVALG